MWDFMLKLYRLSRTLFVICALCTSFLACAQDVPTEDAAFTDFVANKLRQALGNVPVTVDSPLTLTIGPIHATLDRVQAFCKANAPFCAAEVERYVKGATQVVQERITPLDKGAVRLVIRTSEQFKRMLGMPSAQGLTIQSEPFAEGLVTMAVQDTPHAVRPLDNRDLQVLNISHDELMELGRNNLEASMKPVSDVARAAESGQIGKVQGNVFDTSRVVLHRQWAKLAEAQGGTLLVCLPTTDMLIYISESTPTAVDALRTQAKTLMSKALNPLSSTILRWTPKGWEIVP